MKNPSSQESSRIREFSKRQRPSVCLSWPTFLNFCASWPEKIDRCSRAAWKIYHSINVKLVCIHPFCKFHYFVFFFFFLFVKKRRPYVATFTTLMTKFLCWVVIGNRIDVPWTTRPEYLPTSFAFLVVLICTPGTRNFYFIVSASRSSSPTQHLHLPTDHCQRSTVDTSCISVC